MKIEKAKPQDTAKTSLASVLRELKPGQCVRLTTAREAYSIANMHGLMRKSGKKVRARTDGDDVLIWTVEAKP